MKHCPKCNRSFEVEAYSVCPVDATPLVNDATGLSSEGLAIAPSIQQTSNRSKRKIFLIGGGVLVLSLIIAVIILFSSSSGKPLGNYDGSLTDLLPRKTGGFELVDKILPPKDEAGRPRRSRFEEELGITDSLAGIYQSSGGKTLVMFVARFPSTNALEQAMNNNPAFYLCMSGNGRFWKNESRERGGQTVGKRIVFGECSAPNEYKGVEATGLSPNMSPNIRWSNGTVLFVAGPCGFAGPGSDCGKNRPGDRGSRPEEKVSQDELLDFEKNFPY